MIVNDMKVKVNGKELILKGDQVFKMPDGRLTTPFHARKLGIEIKELKNGSEVKAEKEETEAGGKACKVKFVNGKLVKECGD